MNFYKFLFLSIFLLIFSFFLVFSAEAAPASLYLSPATGSYTVGNTFSVGLKVDSGGGAINAAEGALVFDPSELEVVSISESGSIFTLWTTGPSFSNSLGSIIFGGGAPESFSGSAGTIISITFRAKASALSQVPFYSGSVLAADGKGTNVLASMNGGVYTLSSKKTIPSEEEVPPEMDYPPLTMPDGTPMAPILSSLTHPILDQWYSNNTPVFSWQVDESITAVKLLLNENPTSFPTISYMLPIEEKNLGKLEDGVWYFHIRLNNKYGWGAIIHRKILIDTMPPESFAIEVDSAGDSTNPSPVLYFDTTDSLSGVEYYEIKIGQGDAIPLTAAAVRSNPYQMPVQAPGKHGVIVKALDRAGNMSLAATDVIIGALEPPVITDFPKQAGVGDSLIIKGTSLYPNAIIKFFVQKQGEEVESAVISTDKNGDWIFIYDKSLEKGLYRAWAEIVDGRGARSAPTEKIAIVVAPPAFLKIGRIVIDYLTVLITLAAFVAFLVLILFFIRYQISLWRGKISDEAKEAKKTVYQAFKDLQAVVEREIRMFDGRRSLSEREREVRDKLNEALEVSKKAITREIKDVESLAKKRMRIRFRK